MEDSSLPEKVISHGEWAARVLGEEGEMFVLLCEFQENPSNEKARDVCSEFKHGFFDKLKDEHTDAIFAIYDVSLNDPPKMEVKYQMPGVFFFPKGKNAEPSVFDKLKDIGLNGEGDPLKGAIYLTTFKDWATEVSKGVPIDDLDGL